MNSSKKVTFFCFVCSAVGQVCFQGLRVVVMKRVKGCSKGLRVVVMKRVKSRSDEKS